MCSSVFNNLIALSGSTKDLDQEEGEGAGLRVNPLSGKGKGTCQSNYYSAITNVPMSEQEKFSVYPFIDTWSQIVTESLAYVLCDVTLIPGIIHKCVCVCVC